MDEQIKRLVIECGRQEESCRYTSTALYEWLKCLRFWRAIFVVTPILLGGIAAWPKLPDGNSWQFFASVCALLAGLAPAIYKALDLDISLTNVASHASAFKALQDRFRQSKEVVALEGYAALKCEFDALMKRMDDLRAATPVPPERFFRKAQKKIKSGDYDFSVDKK